MKTYCVEGITIEIGCEVCAVWIDGRQIAPKEKKSGSWLQALKENDYFRKKATVKAAEYACRVVGFHDVYLIFREYIYPYLPQLFDILREVDRIRLIFCIDIGFACGVFLTAFLLYVKAKYRNRKQRKRATA